MRPLSATRGRYPAGAQTVPPRAVRGVRCGARSERAAAMPLAVALNAPLPHGFSSVRRLRRQTSPLSTALLSGPDSRQRGTALRPAMRSWCSSTRTSVLPAKLWSGVRRQRHCAALRRRARTRTVQWTVRAWRAASPPGLARPARPERMAARAQRALQCLTRVDCSSAANAVSGASFDAGHAIEHRKGVGPQGRPLHTSAGAYPAAALPRSVFARIGTEDECTFRSQRPRHAQDR